MDRELVEGRHCSAVAHCCDDCSVAENRRACDSTMMVVEAAPDDRMDVLEVEAFDRDLNRWMSTSVEPSAGTLYYVGAGVEAGVEVVVAAAAAETFDSMGEVPAVAAVVRNENLDCSCYSHDDAEDTGRLEDAVASPIAGPEWDTLDCEMLALVSLHWTTTSDCVQTVAGVEDELSACVSPVAALVGVPVSRALHLVEPRCPPALLDVPRAEDDDSTTMHLLAK